MAIEPPSIGSTPINTTNNAYIELVDRRPAVGVTFSPSRTPGQIVGYYNSGVNAVELYMVNSRGNKFLKIV